MIAYNKQWLANLHVQEAVTADLDNQRITAAEHSAIMEQYPVGFYTPNIFVRIGLFILTCVIVLFASGLLTMILFSTGGINGPAWCLILGVLTYAALELLINSNKHYRSGVDDALLFICGCLLISGMAMAVYTNNSPNAPLLWAAAFVLCTFLALRFTDMLMGAAGCAAFFALVFFSFENAGLSVMPFIMMIAAGIVYGLARMYATDKATINYANCFITVQLVSLITLYLAGNYYVVQSLSNSITASTKSIPFGAFFWFWTIALPFVYIFFGIRKKDVILLRTGLLLITAAAITFRNYYHILPIDVTLTLAGAIILAIVYAVMQYLKTPRHGFTKDEPADTHLLDNLRVESLLIAETFAHTPGPPAGTKFGGGDFGGGGASSEF